MASKSVDWVGAGRPGSAAAGHGHGDLRLRALERRGLAQRLAQRGPQPVRVRAGTDVLAAQLLGRHVAQEADL